MPKASKPNGYVFYRGPSMLDGQPIVAIATGFNNRSENAKTGAMIQTWILRENLSPVDAIHTGLDASVCGDCKHRGTLVPSTEKGFQVKNDGRTCYVTVFMAPNSVWKSYRRGIYPEIQIPYLTNGIFHNKNVRIGSYGDPAAVPVIVWKKILHKTAGNTGYTHHWKTAPLEFKNFIMASVDNEEEYKEAHSLGYRTFRIRNDDDSLMDREIVCPASAEKGHKTNCVSCKGCAGLGSKAHVSFAIIEHGPIKRLRQLAEIRSQTATEKVK
jgi:hypothetical protein